MDIALPLAGRLFPMTVPTQGLTSCRVVTVLSGVTVQRDTMIALRFEGDSSPASLAPVVVAQEDKFPGPLPSPFIEFVMVAGHQAAAFPR